MKGQNSFCTMSLEVAAGNEFRGSGGAVNHFSAAAAAAAAALEAQR